MNWEAIWDLIQARTANKSSKEHQFWRELPIGDAIDGMIYKIRMDFAFESGLTPDETDRFLTPILNLHSEKDRLEALFKLDLGREVIQDLIREQHPLLFSGTP